MIACDVLPETKPLLSAALPNRSTGRKTRRCTLTDEHHLAWSAITQSYILK